MAKKYFYDKDSGDSEWSPEGHNVVRRFMTVVAGFIKEEEELRGEPANLRELSYILEYAIQGVVTDELLRRRLGTSIPNDDLECEPTEIGEELPLTSMSPGDCAGLPFYDHE